MRNTIEEMYEKAKRCAEIKGHADKAEDFAGWLSIKYLEGKSQHQIIDFALIDFLRDQYGGVGLRCGSDAIFRARREKETNVSGSNSESVEEIADRMLASSCYTQWINTTTSRDDRALINPSAHLRDEDAEVWNAYLQGYTLKEIAQKFGVTESRIAQRLKAGKEAVLRIDGVREMNRRIDEGKSIFDIDWIRL